MFGIQRDYRWVQLPDLLRVVLEPGVFGEAWLHFSIDNVSPNDLATCRGRLLIMDALGGRHSLEVDGLSQDRSITIYDEVLLRHQFG